MLDHMLEFIKKFLFENFGDFSSVAKWGESRKKVDLGDIDWMAIYDWSILFVFLLIVFVILSRYRKIFDWLSKHILSSALIIWIVGVLIYIVGLYNEGVNGISVVPRAVISSFKMFVVAHDLARVATVFQKDSLYMTIFSLTHFAAAFITFLFIFKMIGYKIKSSWSIWWNKWKGTKDKEVHVFWGMNEASFLLAKKISSSESKKLILFIDMDENSGDSAPKKTTLNSITNNITITHSEMARLDDIGALVDHCNNGPASLNGTGEMDVFGVLGLNSVATIVEKSNKTNFYFLSDSDEKNIVGALNLQRDKRLSAMPHEKMAIYVHARRNASNEVFDHYSQYHSCSERIAMKMIDSAYLSMMKLKQTSRDLPVNYARVNKKTGLVDSPFTSLIVGFGSTGQEAFKFLYEFSAFVGSDGKKTPFKCYAIDEKMNKIAGIIRMKMPAITEEELSLIQTTVDSEEFWKKIQLIIRELNYVVVALNDDSTGLSFAVNLFKYALMHRDHTLPKLKIMVRCYDSGNEKRMTEVKDTLNQSIENSHIEIQIFGLEEDIYTRDIILSDTILEEAKIFNWVYGDRKLSSDDLWEKNFGETELNRLMTEEKMTRYHAIYDINRRIAQNISNSLHRRTKMILMGLDEERLKQYYDYVKSRKKNSITYECSADDADLLENVAMVEHERWIASHKLMGYTYHPEKDCVQKYHESICPWDELDESTKIQDFKVVDTTIELAYEKK